MVFPGLQAESRKPDLRKRPAVFDSDTIAAIATPPGTGSIGIIRVSGPAVCEIAKRIFRPDKENCPWESHRLYHGDVISSDGEAIDEVLAALMRGPHSFTGEDVLEINCHGNPLIMQSILSELMLSGCRPAKPGEFSLRAFLNGRLDLSQAEALAALITARSEKSSAIGLAQLKGALGSEIGHIRNLLIEALAITDAAIDFTEDVRPGAAENFLPQLEIISRRLESLLDSYSRAKIYTEGLNVAIVGRPNVGKSSLLNTLTGRKKAIVTDIPGTTRDLVTDTIVINGMPVRITDTAGIRKPENIIEQAGIDLALENIREADFIIVVLDGSKPLSNEDERIIAEIPDKNAIIAINKTDLPSVWRETEIRHLPPKSKILKISAKFGRGMEDLKNAITAAISAGDTESAGDAVIVNLRQKSALEKALMNISRARKNVDGGASPELTALDLREALDNIDEITGKKINEEILDKIFSTFCIGK